MNKLIITCIEENRDNGMDVIIDARCSGTFLAFAISRVIMEVNKQLNEAKVFKIDNGFWTVLSEQINGELEEIANEKK